MIGAVVYELRLTALGLKGTSYRVKIDVSISLTGRQPKPDKKPAADQMPGGFADSVAAQRKNLMASD